MYQIEWKKEIVSIVSISIMFIAATILYPHLPSQIPIHWNIQGHIDNFATKSFWSVFLIPLVTFGIFLLLLFTPYIDPRKEKYLNFLTVYRILRLSLVLFFFFTTIIVWASTMGAPLPVGKLIPGAISVLFIIIGNFLGKVRRNYFVGIKTPWTLQNETVWNRTHRLGGKCFAAAGVLGLLGLLLPVHWAFTLFFSVTVAAAIVPIIYSYLLSKLQN
jgi:uncharacterized membrane protein